MVQNALWTRLRSRSGMAPVSCHPPDTPYRGARCVLENAAYQLAVEISPADRGHAVLGFGTSPPKIWGWFPGPNDRSEKVPGVGALLPDNPITGLPVPAAPLAGVARRYLIEPGTAPVRRRHGLVRVSRIPPARVPVGQARSNFKPALDLLQAAGLGLEEG